VGAAETARVQTEGRSKPVEIAVIGLGYWGPNRIRVLQDHGEAAVTWVCDIDEHRLLHASARCPGARRTLDFHEAIADSTLDAVVIATPAFTHGPLVAAALEAGKHVFVEKPLADSSAEATELARRAAERNLALGCGHTFVHSPAVKIVKDLLDDGVLGDLHYVSSSRVNLGPYRSDVSVIFDLGSHDFSILRYWLGEMPSTVSASGRDVISRGVCDFAFVNAIYDSGLVANLELSWLAPSKLRRTVLVGSERMVVYEDGSVEPVRIYDSGIEYRDPETYGEYHLAYRTGTITSPRVDSAEPIAAELDAFIRAVRGECDPRPGIELAIDVIRMVEAAEESLSTGGEGVAVMRREPTAWSQ
jgi:predicted dehydrogenase